MSLSTVLLVSAILGDTPPPSASPRERIVPMDILFGSILESCSDIDLDGCDDLLIADPGFSPRNADPVVWVLSARTSLEVSKRKTHAYVDGIGVSLASGADVDGDGMRDWIFGCGFNRGSSSGVAVIESAKHRTDLAVLCPPPDVSRFGMCVGLIGTASSPAYAVVLARNSRLEEWSLIKYSIPDGKVVARLPLSGRLGGDRFLVIDDVDGDGAQDLLYTRDDFAAADAGLVIAASSDGRVLREHDRVDALRYIVLSFAASAPGEAGAVPELVLGFDGFVNVVSAVNARTNWVMGGLCSSGFNQPAVLLRATSPRREEFLIVGDPNTGIAEGSVFAFTQSRTTPLWTATESDDVWHFGSDLAVVGDVDGDGCEDVAVGSCSMLSGARGFASLLSGRTGKTIYRMQRRGDAVLR